MESPKNSVDVAIIGGGPAGISAALWCSELGLNSVLVEQENELGGQLHHIYNPIENYPGVRAANGLEMLSRFEKSIASRNFGGRLGIKATSIDFGAMELLLADGDGGQQSVSFGAMIIATGVRRRVLGIPGESDFRGKGILESGSKDKTYISGKSVMIVGGGDAAFENAMILSDFASSVSVAYRRKEPTARREFVDAAKSRSNVSFLPETIVSEIAGGSFVERVELRNSHGSTRTERLEAVLIRIGVEPNSELVRGVLDLDEAGYIKVDHVARTSAANIYAVGDVANQWSPTLSTATGTAATAVKAIYHSLEQQKAI